MLGLARKITGNHSPVRLVGFGALAWLVLITWLHFSLNGDSGKRQVVNMGYMPVVANLAAPLLDHVSRTEGDIFFRAMKFASFAEMAEALRHEEIQAAFMIAPLAVVLGQQGEDVRVVYVGNRHESTMVTRKGLGIRSLHDLVGRTVAVPIRYSGHNLGLRGMMEQAGLTGRINVVEMNPPDMAQALSTGSLDGYFVGEPFAAQSIRNGSGERLFYVEEIWPGFICNLMLVTRDFMERDPEAVRRLVEGAVRAGLWARDHVDEAATIAAAYWNQPRDLVEYAMTTPPERIVYDRFVPKAAEFADLVARMRHFGLVAGAEIDDLVDDRFALGANQRGIDGVESILRLDKATGHPTLKAPGP